MYNTPKCNYWLLTIFSSKLLANEINNTVHILGFYHNALNLKGTHTFVRKWERHIPSLKVNRISSSPRKTNEQGRSLKLTRRSSNRRTGAWGVRSRNSTKEISKWQSLSNTPVSYSETRDLQQWYGALNPQSAMPGATVWFLNCLSNPSNKRLWFGRFQHKQLEPSTCSI